MKHYWNFRILNLLAIFMTQFGNGESVISMPNKTEPINLAKFKQQFLDTIWNSWKDFYHIKYMNSTEEFFRREIFAMKMKIVAECNKRYEKGETPFKMELYDHADLTHEEFLKRATGLKLSSQQSSTTPPPFFQNLILRDPLPCQGVLCCPLFGICESSSNETSLDWRLKNSVTPVKNQKSCGSCWAFASIAAIESQIAMKTRRHVILSEQQLIDCDTEESGCNGGDPFRVFKYLKDKGITTFEKYPYTSSNGTCRKNLTKETFTLLEQTENFNIRGSESKLLNLVKNSGPTLVAVHVNEKFGFYKTGIFIDDTCNSPPNHALVIVGYGQENGLDYWIAKNSWGTSWGENGYIRIARNHNNMCGIANYAAVPNVQIL